MLSHSGLVWSYGSHRLVELPMWDGNGKAGRAVSQHWILELKIIQARNVRKYGTLIQLAWLRDNVSDTRQYNPLLIFHVLGVLDVCRLINYDTEQDPSQGSMTSRGIYSRIPLLARNEVKTSSPDVLHSSKVLCHRSRALEFVFPGCIFS